MDKPPQTLTLALRAFVVWNGSNNVWMFCSSAPTPVSCTETLRQRHSDEHEIHERRRDHDPPEWGDFSHEGYRWRIRASICLSAFGNPASSDVMASVRIRH